MRIINVEQRSKEWFEMRLGVITGSRCGNVMKSNNLTFMDELIAERLSGEIVESKQSEAMKWGTLMEPMALDAYRMTTGRDAREVGFCVHDNLDWLAISPDALVWEGGDDPVGGVEMKCPSTKNHVNYLRGDKVPTIYRPQVMHYFIVIPTLQWMDFVSYDPRMKVKELFIKRINRSDPQIEMEIEARKVEYMKFWSKLQKYERQITG